MEIIHLLFFPILTLLLPLIFQYFLTEDELFSYFKIYILSFASGFIVNALLFGINSFFAGRSHFDTIVAKTILVDGFLFILIMSGLFYGIILRIIGKKIPLNLFNMTILTIPILLGFYSSHSIYQFSLMAIPNTPLMYTAIMALIGITSFFMALVFENFRKSNNIILKIVLMIFILLILTALTASYKMLVFYNYNLYSYFPVALCALIGFLLLIINKLRGNI